MAICFSSAIQLLCHDQKIRLGSFSHLPIKNSDTIFGAFTLCSMIINCICERIVKTKDCKWKFTFREEKKNKEGEENMKHFSSHNQMAGTRKLCVFIGIISWSVCGHIVQYYCSQLFLDESNLFALKIVFRFRLGFGNGENRRTKRNRTKSTSYLRYFLLFCIIWGRLMDSSALWSCLYEK